MTRSGVETVRRAFSPGPDRPLAQNLHFPLKRLGKTVELGRLTSYDGIAGSGIKL